MEKGETTDGPAVWRFSLEDVRSGRRRGFATWELLVEALQQELRGEKETDGAERFRND